MLQNAYFLAKIGADTAENEQHFAEILVHAAGGEREARLAEPGVLDREARGGPRPALAGGAGAAALHLGCFFAVIYDLTERREEGMVFGRSFFRQLTNTQMLLPNFVVYLEIKLNNSSRYATNFEEK